MLSANGSTSSDAPPNINSVVSNQFDFFNPSFPNDAASQTLAFLSEKELRVADSVSKYFRSIVGDKYDEACKDKTLPPNISGKQWIRMFPKGMGIDFFQEYIGDIIEKLDKKIHLPENYIQSTHPRNIAFLPRCFSRTIDENCPLELDETCDETYAGGIYRARLFENPNKIGLKPSGNTRTLIIPTTDNNLLLIFKSYLKKNPPFPNLFAGVDPKSHPHTLNENGDIGVKQSHWICQGGVEFGEHYYRVEIHKNYGYQAWSARKKGLEIVPTIERIYFQLATYINTGEKPQSDDYEQTSTTTRDCTGNEWPSIHLWRNKKLGFFTLYFGNVNLHDVHHFDMLYGSAVGVPAKKPS